MAALCLGLEIFAGGCEESCPDISGDWVMQGHCEESLIGSHVYISQSGCSFTADWGGPELWDGSASDDGNAVSMSGPVDEGETMDCQGLRRAEDRRY